MKITDITVTPLTIGKGLLRVQTDAGIEGWAEAPGSNRVVPGRNSSVFEAYLESIIKPTLIGEDPLQIDRHWETLAQGKEDRLYKLPAAVVGVIDVALWDLFGKETGEAGLYVDGRRSADHDPALLVNWFRLEVSTGRDAGTC